MTLTLWVSLFSICLLGAMSPGPSLAVILQATVRGGPSAGHAAATAHGLGIALYAITALAGLALIITSTPSLFLGLQIAGAIYLAYLGINSLRTSGEAAAQHALAAGTPGLRRSAFRDGFLVVFLNPKVAVFILALFSQFLEQDSSWEFKATMIATIGFTDALWYNLLVLSLSREAFLTRLRSAKGIIDRVFGVLLIGLSLLVLWRALV